MCKYYVLSSDLSVFQLKMTGSGVVMPPDDSVNEAQGLTHWSSCSLPKASMQNVSARPAANPCREQAEVKSTSLRC